VFEQKGEKGMKYAFVNGIEGAKSFQVSPNQTMLLMDSDSPICYMKTSDSIGQASLRYFKLEEIDENTIKLMNQPKPDPNYVLKADFEKLVAKIDQLINKDGDKDA
jgi:hypothetical protein